MNDNIKMNGRIAKIGSVLFAALVMVVAGYGQSQADIDKIWHKILNDTILGVDLPGVHTFIQKQGLSPQQTVIVGVLDSGIDTAHVDLKGVFWTNPGEIPGNGKDDDRNGYPDDIHGWSFLGSADGSFDVTSAGTEYFRQYKRLRPKYAGKEESDFKSDKQRKEFAYFKYLEQKAGIRNYVKFAEVLEKRFESYRICDSLAKACYPGQDVTLQELTKIDLQDTVALGRIMAALEQVLPSSYLRYGASASWKMVYDTTWAEVLQARERVASLDDPSADPRLKVGDKLNKFSDRRYGNNHLFVNDQDAMHATCVAGIIAGQGVEDPQISGIYPEARIMAVRVVPDGDEYDKDVASAIRYAVDNGAKVINMSFGKFISPHSDQVAKAIRYAWKHDVVLVHAAGNEGINIDTVAHYPVEVDRRGRRFSNMIVVGASCMDGSPASFSCYGQFAVDLFAPGCDIWASQAGGGCFSASGTSMAAPIVAGIAAMIRAYYPELSAGEVCGILRESVTSRFGVKVTLPGKQRRMEEKPDTEVRFEQLSRSGGIVNAAKALKMAEEVNAARQ